MSEGLSVARVGEHPLDPMPRKQWPATVPAVRQLLDEGLELGRATVFEWGIRRSDWDDLDLVRNWRSFLHAPERYLRHLR